MAKARQLLGAHPAVEDVIQVSGFSILSGTSASNSGFISLMLKDWSQRAPLESVMEIAAPASGVAGSDHHAVCAADSAGAWQRTGLICVFWRRPGNPPPSLSR